jgi:hypothetical protein
MADAVRLGTASAILHRYLKTARARPRFRSRGPAIRFSTSPHCESAAAVSARPHFSGTAPASTRSDSDSANSTLHGDEGSGIDWHQRRYCRNLKPEKRCTTSTYVRNEVESKKQLVHPHRTRFTFPSAASCAAAGHTSRRLPVTAAGAHDSAYRTRNVRWQASERTWQALLRAQTLFSYVSAGCQCWQSKLEGHARAKCDVLWRHCVIVDMMESVMLRRMNGGKSTMHVGQDRCHIRVIDLMKSTHSALSRTQHEGKARRQARLIEVTQLMCCMHALSSTRYRGGVCTAFSTAATSA